jgi:hypothetical protein
MIKKLSNKTLLITLAFFASIICTAPVFFTNFFDDAYIHARLAENIRLLGEPFFNEGARFKAGSSTGYIYLIAIFQKISEFNLIQSIRYIEALTIFSSVMSMIWLSSSNKNLKKNLLIAFLALPSLLWAAYGGMETPIFCLMTIWAGIAISYKKSYLALFFISLATAFRFEGIALWLLLFIFLFFRENKKIHFLILCSTPVFLLMIFEYFTFGSVVPYAASVKSIAYGHPIMSSIFNALSFGMGKKGLVLGLILIIFYTSRLWIIIKSKDLKYSDLYFGFSAALILAWAIGRSNFFSWYFCLCVIPFSIAAILDSDVVKTKYNNVFTSIIFLSLMAFSAISLRGIIMDKSSERVHDYLKISYALYQHCPECSLATSEIGGLGYGFKGTVYDAFGLGDPAAITFHPMKVPDERAGHGVGAMPPKYIQFRNPDFIVSMPVFSKAFRESKFVTNYVSYDCPMKLNLWGDSAIQIFSKKDLPADILLKINCQ